MTQKLDLKKIALLCDSAQEKIEAIRIFNTIDSTLRNFTNSETYKTANCVFIDKTIINGGSVDCCKSYKINHIITLKDFKLGKFKMPKEPKWKSIWKDF